MLPAASRLRRTRDIQKVRTGHSLGSRALHIRFLPNGLVKSRATVVVSQRTAKSAVVRNRVKRQIRAVLAVLMPRITPPHDLLVIVHRSALQLSTPEINKNISALLARLLSKTK